MKKVYLDNAATSFPKAPGTGETILNFINNMGSNINRGTYSTSHEAEEIVFETRELICELFKFDTPENVIFTKSITESLNVIIKGLLNPNDHVIVSSVEHNAVMRPLNHLKETMGIEISKVPCNNLGVLNLNALESLIQSNTKAVIMTYASNVCGTILDLKSVGEFCKVHGLLFIVDSAQTAGFLDIDFTTLNADCITFTGHKGLLGPQGIGGFLINNKLNDLISPLIDGGTGSLSEYEIQPNYMPDKFEAGTLNIPGIFGLNNSLKYIQKTGLHSIRDHELMLTSKFLNKLSYIKDLNLIGLNSIDNRTAVISIDCPKYDNAEIAYYLDKDFNIMTRTGLHCAPSAHQTLGTFPKGTIRFSFSHFNTEDEINYTIDALNTTIKRL